MNKRNFRSALILIVCSFIAAWLLFLLFPVIFDTWKLQTNDQLFRLRYRLFGRKPVYPYVIHVDIDDASIQNISVPVEDRRLYTKIIDILTHVDVQAIAFDMLFLKASNNNAESSQALIEATRKAGMVYYPIILRPGVGKDLIIADFEFLWQLNVVRQGRPIEADIAFSTFAELSRAARGIGHITCYPDRDGIFRRFPLLIRCGEGYVPSLSFRMACEYINVPPDRIEVAFGKSIVLNNAQFPDGREKDIVIPVDLHGRIIINFAGPWHDSFYHYSLSKLLEIAEDEDLLEMLMDDVEGDLVIVSDVSTGSRDIGPIPLESIYPLSGLHANILSSILKEDFLSEFSTLTELAVSLLLIFLLLLITLRFHGMGFALSAIVILIIFLLFSAWLFFYQNTLSNIVRSSLGIFSSIIILNIYNLKSR